MPPIPFPSGARHDGHARPPAPEIVDDLTRRRFVAGSLGLGAIILTGCGDDARDGASTTAATAAFPVTIDHEHGATTIPAEPRRVVTVGYNEQDFVLAVGVRPLGMREWLSKEPTGIWLWAREAAGDTNPVVQSDATTLNFEAIAALRPDVIIAPCAGATKADYRKLSRIAPVVEQSDEFIDFGKRPPMPKRQRPRPRERRAPRTARPHRARRRASPHPGPEGRPDRRARRRPPARSRHAPTARRRRLLDALGRMGRQPT